MALDYRTAGQLAEGLFIDIGPLTVDGFDEFLAEFIDFRPGMIPVVGADMKVGSGKGPITGYGFQRIGSRALIVWSELEEIPVVGTLAGAEKGTAATAHITVIRDISGCIGTASGSPGRVDPDSGGNFVAIGRLVYLLVKHVQNRCCAAQILAVPPTAQREVTVGELHRLEKCVRVDNAISRHRKLQIENAGILQVEFSFGGIIFFRIFTVLRYASVHFGSVQDLYVSANEDLDGLYYQRCIIHLCGNDY